MTVCVSGACRAALVHAMVSPSATGQRYDDGSGHGRRRMAIDTLKIAKRLREAGFSDPQAEAVIATVQEVAEGGEFATKPDLKAEMAGLRSDLREVELRLAAKLESIKADILNRVFGLILGPLVVNIVAIVGAVLAAAKLVGH